MNWLTLIVGSLATWRISHMLVNENGPMMVFMRLRAVLARRQTRSGGLFDLISCVYCTSLWIGLICAVWASKNIFDIIAYTFAFSAIATLIAMLLVKLDAFTVITRPAADDKILVSGRAASEKRNDVISHPYPSYGKTAVKATTLLSD